MVYKGHSISHSRGISCKFRRCVFAQADSCNCLTGPLAAMLKGFAVGDGCLGGPARRPHSGVFWRGRGFGLTLKAEVYAGVATCPFLGVGEFLERSGPARFVSKVCSTCHLPVFKNSLRETAAAASQALGVTSMWSSSMAMGSCLKHTAGPGLWL